jgi:Transport and Golgi organisation 2
MCTVSFVRTDGKTIITSNRDEQVVRLAIEPKEYFVNNKQLFYPKDPKAGGTWFVIDKSGIVLILLNGAEEKHIQRPNYQKSRGIIVLDMISSDSPIDFWSEIDLESVEPFTLVLFQNEKLYQLRWNEIEKSKIELETLQKHIWSSSTLYPKEIRKQRSEWFYEYLAKKTSISETDLYHFHRNTENENTENGLIINRNDKLKTLSITQVVVQNEEVTLSYSDLIQEKEFSTIFQISNR